MKMNKTVRKIILIFAVIGIISSSSYLAYELVWLPYSLNMKNREFTVNESHSQQYANENHTKIQQKYADLKSKYPDFAGKIIITGLQMDYPVMQGEDNDYYLSYSFDGKKDKHGAIFVDYRNNLALLNQNTIIYGHNMADSTQFGMLGTYKKLSTYAACPVITFNTVYRDYKWKVFAAFSAEDDFYYLYTNFASEDDFNRFYSEVLSRSYYKTDVEVTSQDKILTLSTCSTSSEGERFVVMARLVRDGESEAVDVSAAELNK